MVVAAHVALDRADPQPAVLAGDVVDQEVQRLGHRGAGGAGEEVVQLGTPTSRESSARRMLPSSTRNTVAPPEDSTSATVASVRASSGDQRARCDQGQVGLGQHVVDRFGQQTAHAVGGALLAGGQQPAPAGGQPTGHDDTEPLGLLDQGRAPGRAGRRGAGSASAAGPAGPRWPGPAPAGSAPRVVSTARRTAGTVCRTTSGDSTLTALPAMSRWPTRAITRRESSQRSGQQRPPLGQGLLAPGVVAAAGQPLVAVRSAEVEQAGGVRDLDEERGLPLVHAQGLGQPLLVADGHPAAAQQARRAPPRRRPAARRPDRRPPARRRRPAGR